MSGAHASGLRNHDPSAQRDDHCSPRFIISVQVFFLLVAALLEEEAKGNPETSLRSARGRGALLAIRSLVLYFRQIFALVQHSSMALQCIHGFTAFTRSGLGTEKRH